jgi:hypothetical protein
MPAAEVSTRILLAGEARFFGASPFGTALIKQRHFSLALYRAIALISPKQGHAMKDDLWNLDATAQAELVRKKELTPLELVEAAIARIEKIDSKLNAVITPHWNNATRAEFADSSLLAK